MENKKKAKVDNAASFLKSRCMVVGVLSNNFAMTVVMFILMCFDTIINVFGIASLSWQLLLMVTSLVPLVIESAASVNSASSSVDSCKPEEPTMPVAAPSVPTYSIVSMHISFSNGMELSLYETDVNEITALLHKIVGRNGILYK